MQEPFPFVNSVAPALAGRQISRLKGRANFLEPRTMFCGSQLHMGPDDRPFVANSMPYFSKSDVAMGYMDDLMYAVTTKHTVPKGTDGMPIYVRLSPSPS
jgi:hypothetical protein